MNIRLNRSLQLGIGKQKIHCAINNVFLNSDNDILS